MKERRKNATTENNSFSVHIKFIGLESAEQIVLPFLLLNTNLTCKYLINLGEIVCNGTATQRGSQGHKYLTATVKLELPNL